MIALPDRGSVVFLVGGAAIWLGVLLGVTSSRWVLLAGAGAAAASAVRRFPIAGVAALVALGGVAGAALVERADDARAALPDGPIRVVIEVEGPGRMGQWDGSAPVRPISIDVGGRWVAWDGPRGRISGPGVESWQTGERYALSTSMRPMSGLAEVWRGSARRIEPIAGGRSLLDAASARARAATLDRLEVDTSDARALLAGFLIGDTTALDPVITEQMRRSGLSHFVAVSGSNVALFLGALFVLGGPLSMGPRRRALLGFAGLLFFVAVVGPDPSVLRASTMAALVLLGHVVGWRPPIWTVLGVAVSLVLLVSPELAFSLGFQLSVAATIGVVAGSRMFPGLRPRWLRAGLGASVGAQIAVAPILLVAIGSIPLWSPVANVLAAPLVVAATGLGAAAAVTGIEALAGLATLPARLVIEIAGAVAPLPQLDAGAVGGLAVLVAAARVRWVRPALALAGAVVVAVSVATAGGSTSGPALIALDVGQGDAIALLGPAGEVVLVDTGPDPLALIDALDRHGIDRVDLLVISHGHADHSGGTSALLDRVPVGAVWAQPGQSESLDRLVGSVAVDVGIGRYAVGPIRLDVIGPQRRYDSVNDEALVLVATVEETRILLTGDIETRAMDDIEPPSVDVLKVPHHGGNTSDLAWLVASGADVAVVSVGENPFGHPSAVVLDALVAAGMDVRRTDEVGDVVVPLGP